MLLTSFFSISDRSAADTTIPASIPTPSTTIWRPLAEPRSALKRPTCSNPAPSEPAFSAGKPHVRFDANPTVAPQERSSNVQHRATSELLAAPLGSPPQKVNSPKRRLAKPEIPMYLNQTNHPVPRPLLRDSGFMSPGDNTINPLEPALPSYLSVPPIGYDSLTMVAHGNPYISYYPMTPLNLPNVQSTPFNGVRPRDSSQCTLEPVVPPTPEGQPPH